MSFQQNFLAVKDEMALNFERESALGRAVTQVVCRAPPIVKIWVRFQTILCQIFGGQ